MRRSFSIVETSKHSVKMSNIECRAVIQFLTKQGKTVGYILIEITSVFGETYLGKTVFYNWNNLFKQIEKNQMESRCIIFLDLAGILLIDYKRLGRTITSIYYADILHRL